MTEERSCETCGLSSYNNVDEKGCGARGVSDCIRYSKWQPIQKAPSFQMTEEEAMCFYRMAGDGHVEFIKRLKQLGCIRKSELVELVEEAEELWSACYRNTELEPSNLNAKLYQALQALKKIIKSSEVRNDYVAELEHEKAELVEFVKDIAYNDISRNDITLDWVQKTAWELLNKHTEAVK